MTLAHLERRPWSLTSLMARMLFGSVLTSFQYYDDNLSGTSRRKVIEGTSESILCSKSRVKSKSPRHPRTIGPKTLSFSGRHGEPDVNTYWVAILRRLPKDNETAGPYALLIRPIDAIVTYLFGMDSSGSEYKVTQNWSFVPSLIRTCIIIRWNRKFPSSTAAKLKLQPPLSHNINVFFEDLVILNQSVVDGP